MEHHGCLTWTTVSGRLIQGRPQAQGFGPLTFNVNAGQVVHHVRTIPAAGVLLSASGVDAVVAEELGEFKFASDAFRSAIGHIITPSEPE